MLFPILIILAGIIITIAIMVKDRHGAEFLDYLGIGLSGATVTFFAALFSLLIPGAISTFIDEPYHLKTETAKIYSMQDNTGIEGHFSLGTGTIEGTLYYYTLQKHDGGYIVHKYSSEDWVVREVSEEPYVERVTKVPDWGWHWVLGFYGDKVVRERINVPEGTIMFNYNVDLQ